MTPVVVKLGGSYAVSPLLRPWLRAIAGAAGRVVLVPGGGPFADAVRAAQPVMAFDDVAADTMALLAMAQYGAALASLNDALVPADSTQAITQALQRHQVPVWWPLRMVRAAGDVPASWAVTSDSLALWLARQLAAPAVLLVKQRRPIHGDVRALIDEGLLDTGFADFFAAYRGAVAIAGPDDLPTASFDPAYLPGIRVTAA